MGQNIYICFRFPIYNNTENLSLNNLQNERNMQKTFSSKTLIVLAAAALSLNACKSQLSGGSKKNSSSVTGWNYDDKNMGSYHVTKFKYPKAGPGLVFVQGGTFVMGAKEDDVMGDWNNVPRRITVPSFYIDETEVANIHYLEYLYWITRVYGADYPEVYRRALPDTLVWRDRLTWIGAPGTRIDPALPLPLILFTPPSLTREAALEALEREGRAWRIVCTSGSLSGLRAAALAGLGITLHARGLIPDGLVEMPTSVRLPSAGDVEFVVRTAGQRTRGPAAELAQTILTNGDQLQRP